MSDLQKRYEEALKEAKKKKDKGLFTIKGTDPRARPGYKGGTIGIILEKDSVGPRDVHRLPSIN